MHVDPYIVLGSAVVGFLVGMTGAGGGALMTPMLILLFSVKPSTAISSDLVAAVLMRPFGAAVHLRKGTVNLRLVGWMVIGSVPMAFLGAYLLHLIGDQGPAEKTIQIALGAALLLGGAAMIIRYGLDRRAGQKRRAVVHDVMARPAVTVAVGMIGGLIVGMTSVGSGSLMIVLLLFVYPMIGANQLVGTDLTQAVPLTLAAALGALAFGHVEFSVTTSIVIGSIPAVLVGSFLSSRAPDRYVRPIITFVVLASGLKYVGVGTTALGWILCAILLVGALVWLATTRPWQTIGAEIDRYRSHRRKAPGGSTRPATVTVRHKTWALGATALVVVIVIVGCLVLFRRGPTTDTTLKSFVPRVITILQSGDFPRICTVAAPNQVATCQRDLRGISAGTVVSYRHIRTGETRVENSRALVVITGAVCLDGQACRSNKDPRLDHSVGFNRLYQREIGEGRSSSFVLAFTKVNGQWFVGGS